MKIRLLLYLLIVILAFITVKIFHKNRVNPSAYNLSIPSEKRDTFRYKPDFRDPFTLSASSRNIQKRHIRNWQLKGILWDEKNPTALIQIGDSTKFLSKGEKIQGTRIIKITPKYIIIKNGQEEKIYIK